MPRICETAIFHSDSWTCNHVLFPAQNSPNRTKGNCIFPVKGRGDRALILPYLDRLMAEVFLEIDLFFSIPTIFRGKRVVKARTKVQTSRPSCFRRNLNFSKIIQTLFSLLKNYLWWKFLQNRTIFRGVVAQPPPPSQPLSKKRKCYWYAKLN